MSTGENESGLRKITEMTRLISIFILLLHFYYCCYSAFHTWQLTTALTDRLLGNIANTGLFNRFNNAKFIALGFLAVSLIGTKGQKDEKKRLKSLVYTIAAGMALYFDGQTAFYIVTSNEVLAVSYLLLTTVGYLLLLSGGSGLSRLIKVNLAKDIFNELNETFPQEERLLQNKYSINLPARYKLKEKVRNSWINIINPFRGLLVVGSPGAGKSWFVIQHIIKQHIERALACSSTTLNTMTLVR